MMRARAWMLAGVVSMMLGSSMGPATAASAAPVAKIGQVAPSGGRATSTPAKVGADVGGGHTGRAGPHVMPVKPKGAASRRTAPSGAHLSYYGGKVLSNVKVVQVIYGPGTYIPETTADTSPSVSSFFKGITNSSYFDWLREYNTTITAVGGQPGTNQTIGRGSFAGRFTITPSTANNGDTIQDADIQTELSAQIAAGHLPRPDSNTLYSIFFRNGQNICTGFGCSGSEFCAYHGTIAAAGTMPELYYTVEPDLAFGFGCNFAGSDFANTTLVASHELIESVTDAEVALAPDLASPLAWADPTYNNEIGDLCAGQAGTVRGGDAVGYTVQAEFSNLANDCIFTRTNDFTISASPSTVSVLQGSGANAIIATRVTAGSPQTVTLTASGLPSGVTAAFNPASVTSGSSAGLTLSVSAGTPAGTYAITLTGTGAPASDSVLLSLTVVGTTPRDDFSVAASPSTIKVFPGSAGATAITTTITAAGSPQSVILSASGLPSDVSAAFNPIRVTAGTGSTLSLSTTPTSRPGTYTVTVTGTGASATHTTTLSLTVVRHTQITDGGFEPGLAAWNRSGDTTISTVAHTGTASAMVGSTNNNAAVDSSVSQTFSAPTGTTTISFWYQIHCTDPANYFGWANATLRDNTTATTTTILANTCTDNATWTRSPLAALTAGHSYTITLADHNDNTYAFFPTYTLYDDVTISALT